MARALHHQIQCAFDFTHGRCSSLQHILQTIFDPSLKTALPPRSSRSPCAKGAAGNLPLGGRNLIEKPLVVHQHLQLFLAGRAESQAVDFPVELFRAPVSTGIAIETGRSRGVHQVPVAGIDPGQVPQQVGFTLEQVFLVVILGPGEGPRGITSVMYGAAQFCGAAASMGGRTSVDDKVRFSGFMADSSSRVFRPASCSPVREQPITISAIPIRRIPPANMVVCVLFMRASLQQGQCGRFRLFLFRSNGISPDTIITISLGICKNWIKIARLAVGHLR